MNPLLIAGGYLALCAWVVSLARAAKRADRAAKRQARLAALVHEAREQADLDNAIFESWAREHALSILREREQIRQLEILYERPCAEVIPISRARRFSRPDTGSAA